MTRNGALVWASVAVLMAADKGPPSGKASNEAVEIEARVHADKAAIRALLGSDLEGVAVVELRILPRQGKELKIDPDDFTLRSDRDGQKSQPFAPSQIAGTAALVVSSGSSGGAVVAQDNGPVWGGIGGRPRRLGTDGSSIGNVSDETVQASVDHGDRSKPNPLLDTLKQKMLPRKETAAPLSGLLYFSLEGKHKPKDLELLYRGPAGKLSIRFK